MTIKKEDSIVVIEGKEAGPTVAIFAGVHGDEVCGVEAFQKKLPEITISRGKVFFVYANLRAIEENVRYTDANMNRCFGKDSDKHIEKALGSYERERALELMPILDQCEALLDIHASTNKESTPFIICEPHSFDIAKNLPDFPIRSHGWDDIETGGTDYYMNTVLTDSGVKGKGVCVECGYLADPFGQKRAENALLSFLRYFDMIDIDLDLVENTDQREIHAYDIYHTVIGFKKEREFYDFELLKEGEIIGYDGEVIIRAKENDVIIFPTNVEGSDKEAFILGRENN
ncbi:MAG: succinylglutamate desuccinylase/aspartoacylase family protein [Patescibacteria group bacterium]|nr:succinylglutamate desuccinylase/aspartoacylase family protein [Patescibacteria group bacterium]